ncbi:MAG: hypothetical protein IPM17_18475 [Verrucomicrobia bacterium]|nr:hypothetical protein [Verrucomicrobiota bacterium]
MTLRQWIHGFSIAGLLGALFDLAPFCAQASPPDEVRLSVSQLTTQEVELAWPASAEGFTLERADSLVPAPDWKAVPTDPQVHGGLRVVKVPASDGERYFRLRREGSLADLFLEYARQVAEDLPLQVNPANAMPDCAFLDPFQPHTLAPLALVPFTSEGGFVLAPGVWVLELESFCLKSSTPAPTSGDGYLPAPLAGPMADLFEQVLRRWSVMPEASQEAAQTLLWAMLFRVRMDALPSEVQTLAARLLSPADLQRLNEAAARKKALEAEFSRRMADALLGPGGLISDLPEDIRAMISFEAVAEDLLTNPLEFNYNDLQNAALSPAALPLPGGEVREIPYGRWAWLPVVTSPAGGLFMRYLPQGYQWTRIEFAVPEPLTLTRDALGRITLIADASGNRLEATYDDEVLPLDYAADPGVRGYAFRNLRFVGPANADDPHQRFEREVANQGWCLLGVPNGSGQAPATPPGVYFEPQGRYDWSLRQVAEIQRLETELNRVHPGRTAGDPGIRRHVHELANFVEAVRLALEGAVPEEDEQFPLVKDWVGLAYRAWIVDFAKLAASGSPTRAGREIGPLISTRDSSRFVALNQGGPTKPPWWHDLAIFRFMDWLFLGHAQPGRTSSQAVGTSGKVSPPERDWNEHYGQYQKNVDLFGKIMEWAGLPDFLNVPKTVLDKGINAVLSLYKWAGTELYQAGSEKVGNRSPFSPAHRHAQLTSIRTDFDRPTLAVVPNLGPVSGGPGISVARLESTRRVIEHGAALGASLWAALVALERQRGAWAAGDEDWYLRQGAYAASHLRDSGFRMLAFADALDNWAAVLRGEEFEDPWISAEQLNAVTERWRLNGFSAATREGLTAFGLTEADMVTCLADRLATEPETEPKTMLIALEELAIRLRDLGRVYCQLPVLPMPSQ